MPRKTVKTPILPHPLFAPGFWPRALGEAWNLFVFSCVFAFLFNAFYSDGIELKYREPKKIYLMDHLKYIAAQEKAATPSPTKNHVSRPSPASAGQPAASPDDPILRISLVGAKSKFDKKKTVFLDARKPEDYQAGHIPGAYNFYSEEQDQYAPNILSALPDKGQDIVCYCHGGDCDMALRDARFLLEVGFTHVEVFLGGWPQWSQAGYPAAKGVNP
jgi:rhodanese-related sulfurtransferase